MPLEYQPPPASGPIRQGELLANVWEHRVSVTTAMQSPPIESRHHPLIVVLSADCDLLWDFNARFPDFVNEGASRPEQIDEAHPSVISYVLACDLYPADQYRAQVRGSEIWRRITSNQDSRYHSLAGSIETSDHTEQLRHLIMDFKKLFALTVAGLYQGFSSAEVQRVALIPPIYVHDLMQRCFGFLSRVGLPD